MAATDRYRQHHSELDALFNKVVQQLHNPVGDKWAHDTTRLLSEFTARLSTHLSVEDNTLYPNLLASGHADLMRMATHYKAEMGNLYGSYMNFWKRWRSAAQLQKDTGDFLKEARAIFSTLRARIEREDRELYPLADRVLH